MSDVSFSLCSAFKHRRISLSVAWLLFARKLAVAGDTSCDMDCQWSPSVVKRVEVRNAVAMTMMSR